MLGAFYNEQKKEKHDNRNTISAIYDFLIRTYFLQYWYL